MTDPGWGPYNGIVKLDDPEPPECELCLCPMERGRNHLGYDVWLCWNPLCPEAENFQEDADDAQS